MSVECSEREMDARSYHAPGCSRYRPERAISRYLIDEELIHPAEAEEVERQVFRVLGEERARLREKVEALRQQEPRCDCGLPATCFGSYEGQEPSFACDQCCGHGCEDGNCVSVWERFAHEVLALLAEPGEEGS